MKTPFVAEIIKKIAPDLGATVIIEPEYGVSGQIIFKNGKKTFFTTGNFDINALGSSQIAKNKSFASFFLNQFGYKVPVEKTFPIEKFGENLILETQLAQGLDFAKQIGFPVITKPSDLGAGRMVTKVYNQEEYQLAAKEILLKNLLLIVQKFYSGNDYRVVVLDDEIIAAYQRIPLFVIGDGKSSISELLCQKQESFYQIGRNIILNLDDVRIKTTLQRKNLTFNSIIPKEVKLYLLDNANLSTGGDAVDVTNLVHADFYKLAVNITKDMGLRLCGVDIMTRDISQPMEDYVIIEINNNPELRNFYSIGDRQQKIVENLYLKILKILETE